MCLSSFPPLSRSQGEFGEVHMGRWNGTLVAVKVLHKSDEVAMGDFRTEVRGEKGGFVTNMG